MSNKKFIEGMNIIAKYIPKDKMDDYDYRAEHDQIWFCEYSLVTDKNDIAKLLELGWFEDEDRWSFFT